MTTEREIELIRTAITAGMTSRQELANFMAQVGHESGGLIRLEESFRYTRGIDQIPVRSAWREGVDALESARVQALNGQPERLAELMYSGRMGNAGPTDGYDFRGRGYMQLTGRDNYRAAGEALGLDLIGILTLPRLRITQPKSRSGIGQRTYRKQTAMMWMQLPVPSMAARMAWRRELNGTMTGTTL